MQNNYITVVTPTYNRAKLLHRVYESLCAQSFREFEWIIVDDGSADNTKEIVDEWIKQADFPITYYYQNNSGKHVAVNKAVKMAKGEWIIIADSDDSFRPDSFEFMINEYENIPENERSSFRGISCRCYNEQQSGILGDEFPDGQYILDCRENDFKYKLCIAGELWGMTKKSVMLEYSFPEIQGAKFYPESIIWDSMSEKYLTRYVNEPLRFYFRDADNSITTAKKYSNYTENFHLWIYNINANSKYILSSPKLVIKSYVGFSMDTFFCGIKYSEALKKIHGFVHKCVCVLFTPFGYTVYALKKRR